MLLAMDSKTAVSIVDGLLLLIFFVGVPSIAVAIAYTAWKGRPKSFDRESDMLGFVACILASGFLLVYAQRMHADVRTWQYLVQIACGGFGLLLFGIAMGCGIGIFTCWRRSGPQKPPEMAP
jgi:formate-dependent nitrite reductase membrane component NrfD